MLPEGVVCLPAPVSLGPGGLEGRGKRALLHLFRLAMDYDLKEGRFKSIDYRLAYQGGPLPLS
jgi:hypothetical protein